MAKYYINQYRINRAYGGPEEGGWWFDCGIFLYQVPEELYAPGSLEAASMLRDRLQERADAEQDSGPDAYLHDVGSVCCEGRIAYRVEEEPGADYPTERPYYE